MRERLQRNTPASELNERTMDFLTITRRDVSCLGKNLNQVCDQIQSIPNASECVNETRWFDLRKPCTGGHNRSDEISLSFPESFEHASQEAEIVPAHFPSSGGRSGTVKYDVHNAAGWEFHCRNASA